LCQCGSCAIEENQRCLRRVDRTEEPEPQRGAKSVNVVKTYEQLIAHQRAVDAAVASMSQADVADMVYFPQRTDNWHANITIRS